MPRHDHFRPPLSQSSSWEEIHGGWPMVIVQQLGKLLPPQYVAGPRAIQMGSAEWLQWRRRRGLFGMLCVRVAYSHYCASEP